MGALSLTGILVLISFRANAKPDYAELEMDCGKQLVPGKVKGQPVTRLLSHVGSWTLG